MPTKKNLFDQYIKINLITLCSIFSISFLSLHFCNYFIGSYFDYLSFAQSYEFIFYLSLSINILFITIAFFIKEYLLKQKYKGSIEAASAFGVNVKQDSYSLYFAGLALGCSFSLLILIQGLYHMGVSSDIANVYEFYKEKNVSALFFIIFVSITSFSLWLMNFEYKKYLKQEVKN